MPYTNTHSCRRYRNIRSNFDLRNYDSPFTLKTAWIKKTIKEVLTGTIKSADVPKLTEDYFKNTPTFDWKHPAQAEEQAADAVRMILRYTNSEDRYPLYLGKKTVTVLHHSIDVYADETFITTSRNGKDIEVVKFKCSKPNVSQKAADLGSQSAIGLYELLLYARTLLTGRGKEHIRASFYYLSKQSDKYDNPSMGTAAHFEKGFFGRNYSSAPYAHNVVTLEENYSNGLLLTYVCSADSDTKLVSYDELYKPAIKKYLSGKDPEECTPQDCAACEFSTMCQYSLPPLAKTEEKETRRARRMSLTPAQREAADFDHGICRINAGAGTGKTNTVKAHFVSLCHKGYDPEKILVITFTNSGAEEMKGRILSGLKRNGIDANPEKLWITTFNSFGYALIRKDYRKLGFTAQPKVIDDVERFRIIASILNSVPEIEGLDYRNFTVNERYVKGALAVTAAVFALAKKYQLAPSQTDVKLCVRQLREKDGISVKAETAESLLNLYVDYDKKLRAANLIEYDDQIVLLSELLYQDPTYFNSLGFEHIIVDEFQDTDIQQIDLLNRLIDTPSFKSMVVVGDDSQAIFSFRDTSPEFLINFEKYVPNPVTDVYLLNNFRCTPEIIDFANKVNDMNVNKVSKSLIATRPSGDPVTVCGFLTKDDEYRYISEQIKENIREGMKPDDIAFIAFSRPELLKMAGILSEAGIPSVLMNPEALIENCRVRAGLSLIKAIQNPKDKTSVMTYLSAVKSGGLLDENYVRVSSEISDCQTMLYNVRSLPEAAKRARIISMLEELDRNDDEVFENFLETIKFCPTCKRIYDYASDFELYGQKVAYRRNHAYPGVVLTTAHSSKGLEWKYVYVSVSGFDAEETSAGVLTTGSRNQIEELHRLLFVSATRARDRLVITGKWQCRTYTDDSGIKWPVYNRMLRDSFKAIGEKLTPSDVDAIVSAQKEALRSSRKTTRKAAAKQKPRRTFAARKTRALRRKGNPHSSRHQSRSRRAVRRKH